MARNFRLALKIEERNNAARLAEENENIDKAIKLYEQNINEDYADDFAFDRLMIIYRKQKQYKDELRVIKRGIDLFQENMKQHLRQSLGRHVDGKKVEQISNAIMKKSGLKKDEFHFPDPIDKWMKRKLVVEKKLKK